MVPDDTSTRDETRTDSSTRDETRTDSSTRDETRTEPSARDRYDPDAGSDGLLSPGDDAPAETVDLLLYGLLGGVVGSVLSFVPFATVLGGAVAGYLCGGTSADGLKTGAVAGVVMMLPFLAMVAFVLFLFGFAGAPAEFGLFALLVIGVGVAYTLGSGVVGGYLGHFLRGRL